MNNIRVDIRLRPIRFGFLVRPDDKENILEIFRINTCLWGGMFNPIIPFFESVPSWLESEGFHFENPKQMINAYLDFFEPDFLVEAEEGLAEKFGFDPERVRKLADMIEEPGGNYAHRYGLSVYGIYRDLYTKEFQFEQRHKDPVVHVQPADTAFINFAAANFGSFPTQERLRYFEQNYKGIFNPKPIALDAATLAELYQSGHLSALRIGCEKLRGGSNDHPTPTLFILDAHKSKDLVDFWNLRAIHQQVVPVPIQWLEELLPFCRRFIRDNYHRQPNDPNGTQVGPTLMFSRSLSEGNAEEMIENHSFADEGAVYTIQRWAPSIWYKLSAQVASPTRPTIAADRKIMNVPIDGDNPEIRFDPLFPEFVSEYNRFRVANVVRLQDWSNTSQVLRLRDATKNDQIATVFPCNYKNPSVPKFQPELQQRSDYLLPTTEGLVIFPSYEDMFERWSLVDGTTAFNQWLNDKGMPAIRSDAGRTTEQIIQTLGGLQRGVLCIAHKGVIELLDEMTGKLTKATHYKEFKNKIHSAIDHESMRDRTANTLVERKAVELGLELKCSKCSSWSWYSLKQLDYLLTCDLCRKQYDFPVINPMNYKHSRWAYRVIGPFALPGYAQGGYAAALAIHFFAEVIGEFDQAEVTWSSAQKLKLQEEPVEVDFMLWYRRKDIFGTERSFFGTGLPIFGMDRPTETVFGEAKSFGEHAFKQDDVDRMKLLAEKFPGAILVFATMKEKLSPEEIDCIKELAEWGREYNPERRQTRAPVIVLTGTELFTSGSLTTSWERTGGRHEALASQASLGTSNLRILANFTQHLYLDLEMLPYGPTMAQRRETMTQLRESIGRNRGLEL